MLQSNVPCNYHSNVIKQSGGGEQFILLYIVAGDQLSCSFVGVCLVGFFSPLLGKIQFALRQLILT